MRSTRSRIAGRTGFRTLRPQQGGTTPEVQKQNENAADSYTMARMTLQGKRTFRCCAASKCSSVSCDRSGRRA